MDACLSVPSPQPSVLNFHGIAAAGDTPPRQATDNMTAPQTTHCQRSRASIGTTPPMPSRKTPATRPPHGLAGRTGPDANASKPPAEKLQERAVFLCRSDELTAYQTAATRTGKTLSAWIRTTLNKAARK